MIGILPGSKERKQVAQNLTNLSRLQNLVDQTNPTLIPLEVVTKAENRQY